MDNIIRPGAQVMALFEPRMSGTIEEIGSGGFVLVRWDSFRGGATWGAVTNRSWLQMGALEILAIAGEDDS